MKSPGAPTQVVRTVGILRKLSGRRIGVRLDDLAAEYNVSRDQIRRDLLALEEAGVRLEYTREEGRYGRALVRLVDAEWVPIHRSERFTLLAARRMFDVFRGTPLYENIEAVFDRITDTLPAKDRAELRSLADRIVYLPSGGTKSYDDPAIRDTIDALETAVLNERLVRYHYKPRFGPESSGTLAPYAFVLYRQGLYIVASRLHGDQRQDPRVFAVERFQEAEFIRRSTFTRPPDLNLDTLFDGAFDIITGHKVHHVVIDLRGPAAAEAQVRKWHRSQVLSEAPEGSGVRIEMELSSLREVASWVRGWSPHARAVAPAALRRLVQAGLRDGLAFQEARSDQIPTT